MSTRRRCPLSYYLAAALLLLVIAFLNAPLTAAQPLPWQLCGNNTGDYTEGSAYQANIRVLASGFPKNASSSPALFTKGSAGTAPDVVYALALCRGDTNASSCASCVAAAFRNAQQLCAFNRHATIAGAAAAFDAASGRLVNATADFAAKDPSRRFGTGEEGFDETYPKIYSLAQCTPDMTAAECQRCLRGIIGRFTPQYFVSQPGGRVFGVRCNFRFETYSFFSGRPLLQLPGALPPATAPAPAATGEDSTNQDDIQSIDSLLLDLATLRAATDNFSESNKLGEGGFGSVYKGVLSEGQEIAVKRLSQTSTQGVEELKTELVLVAKLQHKNLVRLVGVCLESHEKLLVYEYMPNRSLDTVLFGTHHSSTALAVLISEMEH
ncbi:hypothetical protein ACQ4PT_034753 [Festuca glaucescens]